LATNGGVHLARPQQHRRNARRTPIRAGRGRRRDGLTTGDDGESNARCPTRLGCGRSSGGMWRPYSFCRCEWRGLASADRPHRSIFGGCVVTLRPQRPVRHICNGAPHQAHRDTTIEGDRPTTLSRSALSRRTCPHVGDAIAKRRDIAIRPSFATAERASGVISWPRVHRCFGDRRLRATFPPVAQPHRSCATNRRAHGAGSALPPLPIWGGLVVS
jgi:hypothetical protein